MNLLVLMRMVPDVVEDLDVAPDGRSLDLEWLRLIVSERDDHALEQALLLKERFGGSVVVVAPEAAELDDVLYTALAKGADRVVKIDGIDPTAGSRVQAGMIASTVREIPGLLPVDLILTGSQATGDLDGLPAPLLSDILEMPYVGLINSVELDVETGSIRVTKEFAGGVQGRYEMTLPAVIGIQAAEKPPRYVPIAKVRAAMSSGTIEVVEAAGTPVETCVDVLAMAKPEATGKAEMLTGSVEEVSAQLALLLAERALVR